MFPLRKVNFEGLDFSVLGNAEQYLTSLYGDQYMGFPRTGTEHHGGENGPLQSWAKKSGTDMNQVIAELEKILKTLETEM